MLFIRGDSLQFQFHCTKQSVKGSSSIVKDPHPHTIVRATEARALCQPPTFTAVGLRWRQGLQQDLGCPGKLEGGNCVCDLLRASSGLHLQPVKLVSCCAAATVKLRYGAWECAGGREAGDGCASVAHNWSQQLPQVGRRPGRPHCQRRNPSACPADSH